MLLTALVAIACAVAADGPLGPAGMPLTASCPEFVFGDWDSAAGDLVARSSAAPNETAEGAARKFLFPPISLPQGGQLEVEVTIERRPVDDVWRKAARFRLRGADTPRQLKEIVLQRVPLDGAHPALAADSVQSHAVFLDGAFLGVEFPIAATRVDGGQLVLASRPGWTLKPDTWYESRSAICGMADKGRRRQAFRQYILKHRPEPRGLHVNYNSWWTAPAPYYTEDNILELIKTFKEKLFTPHGAAFDTFCIDMGWSDPKSLWQIDRRLFPAGFARIRRAAEQMQCRLGLWISPSSRYPTALDNAWAAAQGYEPNGRALCLGGARYQAAFRKRLVEMATRHGVRHFKLDGYAFTCPHADHGHAPGVYSAEAIAEGIIAAAAAARKVAPDAWFEPTCFGGNPSPWWLFTFNSVIGSYGDDAPHGRVPAPVYRESYTSARDFFNLQGAYWSPVPQAGAEVLGIIHQTTDSFLNDAVMTVLRGHMFLPIYLNPKYMDQGRWSVLAQLLAWARRNARALEQTEPLLPVSWREGNCPRFAAGAPMPREPYGYAHWRRRAGAPPDGLVVLRNPWLEPAVYPLAVPAAPGTATIGGLNAISLFPEPRRYATGVQPGDSVAIPLAPYETVVLAVGPGAAATHLPAAADAIFSRIDIAAKRVAQTRTEFQGTRERFGPDWTCPLSGVDAMSTVSVSAAVRVDARAAQLHVLLDHVPDGFQPDARLTVNGQNCDLTVMDSDFGWSASGRKRPEHWVFLSTSLAAGQNRLALEIRLPDGIQDGVETSAWLLAARAPVAAAASIPNAVPGADVISTGSRCLLAPAESRAPAGRVLHAERPVQRIDGIYLDALEPVSADQGWGSLRRNQSVWQKPLALGCRRFRRGLGTHAPAHIVYAIGGRYDRFQAWVGADRGAAGSIAFEVRVDGQERFASDLLTRDDPPSRVDVGVRGAKTLELVVTDGGDGMAGDHADWADAKLLRARPPLPDSVRRQ